MIVEFGCGGEIYGCCFEKKRNCIGIDLSIAVEPAYENLKHYEDVLIVQGDI